MEGNKPELRELRRLIRVYLFYKHESCNVTSGYSITSSNSLGTIGLDSNRIERGEWNIHDDLAVFHSATVFYTYRGVSSPIEQSMKEIIRSNPSYRGNPRHDTVLVRVDNNKKGFAGMRVARIMLLFSFTADEESHECALVQFFHCVGDSPDTTTGMWIVEPEFEPKSSLATSNGRDFRQVRSSDLPVKVPKLAVIALGSIIRLVHLLEVPIVAGEALPNSLTPDESLDFYEKFYVNRFADMHMHEMLYDSRQ